MSDPIDTKLDFESILKVLMTENTDTYETVEKVKPIIEQLTDQVQPHQRLELLRRALITCEENGLFSFFLLTKIRKLIGEKYKIIGWSGGDGAGEKAFIQTFLSYCEKGFSGLWINQWDPLVEAINIRVYLDQEAPRWIHLAGDEGVDVDVYGLLCPESDEGPCSCFFYPQSNFERAIESLRNDSFPELAKNIVNWRDAKYYDWKDTEPK